LEALTRAVDQGKIRVAGCSNFNAPQLWESLTISRGQGLQRLEEVQLPYSLVQREIESELLPLCTQEQIGVIAYSPLGAGFLSGKYESRSVPKGSRFDVIPGHADIYFTEQRFATVERLRQKSTDTNHPMARLAMGWVLRKQGITSVLVGASRLSHLENAIQAMEMDFTDEWMHEMDGWEASCQGL
jgi:1-deoxyxylulose-5-phosphate synthase